jgi:hypothetical protein
MQKTPVTPAERDALEAKRASVAVAVERWQEQRWVTMGHCLTLLTAWRLAQSSLRQTLQFDRERDWHVQHGSREHLGGAD